MTTETTAPPSRPAGERWRTLARMEGLGPDDLGADVVRLLDRQAAVIQREEDAHRILNRIVLAGGSLTELCTDLISVLGEEGRAAAIVTRQSIPRTGATALPIP